MWNLKAILFFILLWAVPVKTNSQDAPFKVWLDQIPESQEKSAEDFFSELDHLVEDFRTKRHRYQDQSRLVQRIFYKVHRKYLRRYSTPSTLTDLVEDGYYDCITGTALYAIIFDKLGLDYTIVENTYHVFLKLDFGNKMVLVEPTNPLGGFIADPEMIKTTLKSYREDLAGQEWRNQEYYRPYHEVDNEINLVNLAGLQYFNMAAKAYNQRNLRIALTHLSTALELYPSTRLKEMMVLMLNTMEQDPSTDPFLKQDYMSRYGHLRYSIITAQIEK
jgi:hypothetical protein